MKALKGVREAIQRICGFLMFVLILPAGLLLGARWLAATCAPELSTEIAWLCGWCSLVLAAAMVYFPAPRNPEG